MPTSRTPADAQPLLEKLDGYLAEAGRTRAAFGLEARIPYGEGQPDQWAQLLAGWRALGATHASVNTMGRGFATPQAHLAALQTFARAVAPGGA